MKAPKEQAIPHLGYMGHLYVIANTILKSSKKHSAIFYLVDDVPQRGWKKFVEKLQQINGLEQQFTPPPPLPNNTQQSKKGQFKFSGFD